ncbi:MAG: Omega-amidase YafV [Candidatus Erwinia impunctatus]|nr:Omega-amidase YafV [Culicoides impunctatus]
MPTLALTLLQQPLSWLDAEANLQHFSRLLTSVRERDLIILPEMFTSGFSMDTAQAASLDESRIIDWMTNHAGDCDAMLGGSVALRTEKGAVNRFLLVSPQGEVYRYDKRHLFRMAEEHHHYLAGEQRQIVHWRGFRLLPQICYDLRFPVFSRNRNNEYDLALYVASWPAPRAQHWQALLLARAIENQAYVAGCNRVGDDPAHHYQGNSVILSPLGETLASDDNDQPARLDASLSLSELQAYRTRFPAWQDADSFVLTQNKADH